VRAVLAALLWNLRFRLAAAVMPRGEGGFRIIATDFAAARRALFIEDEGPCLNPDCLCNVEIMTTPEAPDGE
jgi:hypothetical protein